MTKVYISTIFLLMLFLYPALAEEKPEKSARSALQADQLNFFFPFHDCIVATIRKVHHVQHGLSDCIFLTADITKVVRGKLRVGMAVFAIRGDTVDLRNTRETLEKNIDRQAVLAFSPYFRGNLRSERTYIHSRESALVPWFKDSCASRAIWISRVYMPLCGKVLSDIEVKNVVGPIEDSIYPYSHCIVASIVKVINVSGSTVEIVVLVKDVLFGQFYEKGEKVKLLVPRSLLPKKPISQMESSNCVWEFGGTLPDKEVPNELINGHSPFPGQIFSVADINRLKTKLSEEKLLVVKRRNALLSCLKARWTPQRIKDFCRPENRWNLLTAKLDSFRGDDVWSGQLYSDLDLACGKTKLKWEAVIVDGIPEEYEIWAEPRDQKPPIWNVWHLDFREFSDLNSMLWTDEHFQQYRLTRTIDNLTMAYQMKHRLELNSGIYYQWSRRPCWETKMLRAANKKAVGYSCPLADGQLLQAALDDEQSIKQILIGGKENPEWSRALTEVNQNLDHLNYISPR